MRAAATRSRGSSNRSTAIRPPAPPGAVSGARTRRPARTSSAGRGSRPATCRERWRRHAARWRPLRIGRRRTCSSPARLVAPAHDPARLMHPEARGCLFDLCETRRDIETKLQAGHLCLACAHSLEAAGVALPRVLRLVEAIQFLATAAAVVH